MGSFCLRLLAEHVTTRNMADVSSESITSSSTSGPTYDLGVVGEGFGLAGLVVGLPLQLDEHRRGLLQVQVSVLWSLEDDGELRAGKNNGFNFILF